MIKKIANGSWMYRFYYQGKDIRKKGFASKHEAQESEAKRKAELQGIAFNTNNLAQVYEMFENKRKMRLKASTIYKDRKQIQTYILPFFTYISDITPTKIIKWKSDLLEKNFSEKYVNQIIKCFKQLLTFASKQAPLQQGVLDELETVKLHKLKNEMLIWSIEEYITFISAFKPDDPYKLLFETLFYSGLRIGELRGLTKNDIQGNELVINKRREYRLKDKSFTTLKTSNSNRRVLMPSSIITKLKALETDILFPISETQIRRVLDKKCAESQVKKIRLHDFRHSHASYLLNNGCSIRLVSERLGHSSPSITMDYYWHLLPNEQEKVIKLIEETIK